MKHSGLTYAGLLIFLLLTFVGCKEANKLKSGGRKVTSGIKKAQGASDKLMKKLGIADSVAQDPDSLNTELTPLEQKTFINQYATLYDGFAGTRI